MLQRPAILMLSVLALLGVTVSMQDTLASLARTVPADGPRIIPYYRKLQPHELFNAAAHARFRRAAPARFDERPKTKTEKTSTGSQSPFVIPVYPVSESGTMALPLRLENLTRLERSQLEIYIEKNGCPYDADAAFTTLCNRLLRKQPQKATKIGPKNPWQSR